MELNFRNVNLLNLILKWIKLLLLIQVAVILISIVFSSPTFIKQKYKSWAVVYPANIKSYSDESTSEQMVQVFNATEIRQNIIEKFNLMEHYKIDPNQKYAQTKMIQLYKSNVSISKTFSDAVRIEVSDVDKGVAKQMVDAILLGYESKTRMLQERRYGEKASMWNRAIERKLSTIDSLKENLHLLATQHGLIDFDAQVAEMVKGYLGTVEGGLARVDKKRVEELKTQMDEKGGDLIVVMDRLKEENILLSDLVAEKDEALANLDSQESYMDVIESAFVADKTSGVIRWIIVIGSMLSAAFISIAMLAVFDAAELKK